MIRWHVDPARLDYFMTRRQDSFSICALDLSYLVELTLSSFFCPYLYSEIIMSTQHYLDLKDSNSTSLEFSNIIDSWPSFSWYLFGNENFKHYSSTRSLFRCSIWSNPLMHHGFWTSSGQGCVQINVSFLTNVLNSKHYQHQISSNSQWLSTSFLPKPFHCSVVQKGDTSNIWEAYIKSVPTFVGAWLEKLDATKVKMAKRERSP